MESIKKILFLCDGNVPECKKTHCYKSGGECKCTSDIRHAINFENVSEYRKKDKQERVKPFDPAEVARLCPIVREVIVMGDEDD